MFERLGAVLRMWLGVQWDMALILSSGNTDARYDLMLNMINFKV